MAALLTLPLVLLLATPAQASSTILVLGDSLSAAYGMRVDEGWVALLQQRLPDHRIVNASISGETTDGGVNRLPALLKKHRPDIVIIELGGNDGLRGFQIQRIRDNLAALVGMSREAGAQVLLLGMKIPPNYGLRYTREFHDSFAQTAKRFDIPLLPFLLDGIATRAELMQEDRIHPNAKAQPHMLDNVWPYLEPLIAAF
jgi:acyl-CoA thioesterase-1